MVEVGGSVENRRSHKSPGSILVRLSMRMNFLGQGYTVSVMSVV